MRFSSLYFVIAEVEFYSDDLMQKIAAELNYSETSFVKKLSSNCYHIRWFSPKDECGLCGHATLAAAHLLWEQNIVEEDIITFECLRHILIST